MVRIGFVSAAALATVWSVASAFAFDGTKSEPVSAIPSSHDERPTINAKPGDARPVEITVPTPAIVMPVEAPKVEVPKADIVVEAKPALTLSAEIADRLKREKTSGGDREDHAAAAKIYEQRGGAPIWVGEKGLTKDGAGLVAEIRKADDFGLAASAFRLPEPRLEPSRADLADADVTLSLAALKYARHARGGRIDPQQLSKYLDRKPVIYAPESVLAELARAKNPGAYLRSLHPSNPQFEKLRLKYLDTRAGKAVAEPVAAVADEPAKGKKKSAAIAQPPPPSSGATQKKLLANMEMWRWMPDLGDTYVQNNIPEFTTRMVRGGKTVHLERIVTGKTDTQTPIFSNDLQIVVFQPFWNVPESIKWKELQPQLTRNGGALQKAGLRAAYNGREVDPETVDWTTADMRAFHIYQPPGAGNALGQVKFLFPNKHDVYMHDTPTKSLFANPVRAYSHGCMRVRDPLKFAEMLLSEDQGMPMSRIVQLANSGPQNNEIRLKKKVPIHVTYFTAWVDDDGKLKTFADIYGHEPKVHLGLEGKAHLIAQEKDEKYVPPLRTAGGPRFVQKNPAVEDWIKKVFNF